MSISAAIRSVFGRFQNLNLLALINDLRANRVAREDWVAGSLLCPIAHGLASREQVRELNLVGEFANLQSACMEAARYIGASPFDIACFVKCWDACVLTTEALLCHLEDIWAERLADAEAVQAVLAAPLLQVQTAFTEALS